MPSSGRPALSGIFETVLYFATGQEGEIERFYGEVLGLRAVSQSPTHFAFRSGDGMLLFFDTGETLTRDDRDMRHGADGRIHTCFITTDEEYERWKQYLPDQGVPILREITWPNGVLSFYFDDPAGNLLEIANGDLAVQRGPAAQCFVPKRVPCAPSTMPMRSWVQGGNEFARVARACRRRSRR